MSPIMSSSLRSKTCSFISPMSMLLANQARLRLVQVPLPDGHWHLLKRKACGVCRVRGGIFFKASFSERWKNDRLCVLLECSVCFHVLPPLPTPRQNGRGLMVVFCCLSVCLCTMYVGWPVNEIPAALPGLWADEKRLESVDKK